MAPSRPGGWLARRLVVLAMLMPSAAHLEAHAAHGAENDLKAAYVYNFVVLATWPADLPQVLRICIAGNADAKVFGVLAGKVVRDRTLSVVAVATPDQTADCAVLYIPPIEARRLGAWLTAVANRPTLTISDQAQVEGAIVNLRIVGQQIVFDVDIGAAAAARIQLSSQLIKLAARRK